MRHVLAVLAAILWLALNVFLWGAVKSPAELFILSMALGVGFFTAFFWYLSRNSN